MPQDFGEFMQSRQGAAPPPADFGEFMAQKQAPPSTGDRIIQGAKNFGGGVLSGINPLHGVGDTLGALVEDPGGTLTSVAANTFAHPWMAAYRGYQSAKEGKAGEAAAHFASSLDPTGFQTEDSLVKLAKPGQRAEGFGELTGGLLQAILMAKAGPKLPAVATKAKELAAEHPKLTGGVGAGFGAAVGHATGIPGAGYGGAYIGREIGEGLSNAAKGSLKAKTPPPLPTELAPPPGAPQAATPKGVPSEAELAQLPPEVRAKYMEALGRPQTPAEQIALATSGKVKPLSPPPGSAGPRTVTNTEWAEADPRNIAKDVVHWNASLKNEKMANFYVAKHGPEAAAKLEALPDAELIQHLKQNGFDAPRKNAGSTQSMQRPLSQVRADIKKEIQTRLRLTPPPK